MKCISPTNALKDRHGNHMVSPRIWHFRDQIVHKTFKLKLT